MAIIFISLTLATGCARRVAKGVTALAPAGIVIGILTGTEGASTLPSGDYNKAINKRTADIKRTCGIQELTRYLR